MLQPESFSHAAGLYPAVIELFRAGLADRRHGFHLMTLATRGQDEFPEARTVVLRDFDPVGRLIYFYTDLRSPKARELRADPRATLVLFDRESRCQTRVRATCIIHMNDELSLAAWGKAEPAHRAMYTSPDAPSTVISTQHSPAADSSGYARFCVVACHFNVLEVLLIRDEGHIRARLDWQGAALELTRLVP